MLQTWTGKMSQTSNSRVVLPQIEGSLTLTPLMVKDEDTLFHKLKDLTHTSIAHIWVYLPPGSNVEF